MIKKNDSVDFTKLVLSYFVIGIHTKILNQELLPLFRLAVPIFFIYSAYFFFNKPKPNIKKFVNRNLRLYFFWFIVLLPITFFVRKYYSKGLLVGSLTIIKDILVGSTFLASWYISALTIAVIIVYFIIKNKIGKILLPIIMILSMNLSLIGSNYYFVISDNLFLVNILKKWLQYLGAPCNSFVVGVFWVGIGYYLAKYKKIKDSLNCNKKIIAYIIISILGVFGESHLINMFKVEILSDEFYLMLIPASIFIVIYTLNCNIQFKNALTFRKLSTFNYCLHFSVAVIIDNIIKYLRIPNPFEFVTYVITIFICYLAYIIVTKISKFKYFSFLKYSM